MTGCVSRSLLDLGRLTSENRPQRGQFLPDLQAHSPAMGQNEVSVKTNLYSSYVGTKKMVRAKCGEAEKWTAAVDLQPTTPKSDRLLSHQLEVLPAEIQAGQRFNLSHEVVFVFFGCWLVVWVNI